MIASLVILGLAGLLMIGGVVYAIRNRPTRLSNENRRAGEDEPQDPAMKADLLVNRSGSGF